MSKKTGEVLELSMDDLLDTNIDKLIDQGYRFCVKFEDDSSVEEEDQNGAEEGESEVHERFYFGEHMGNWDTGVSIH